MKNKLFAIFLTAFFGCSSDNSPDNNSSSSEFSVSSSFSLNSSSAVSSSSSEPSISTGPKSLVITELSEYEGHETGIGVFNIDTQIEYRGEGYVNNGEVKFDLFVPDSEEKWTGYGEHIIALVFWHGMEHHIFLYTNGQTFEQLGIDICNSSEEEVIPKLPKYNISNSVSTINLSKFQASTICEDFFEDCSYFSTLYINQHYISAKLALKETKMSRTTSLALRLDADLKEQASSVAEALGMDLTTAIRLYLTQLVFHKGIPFPIALEKQEDIPNAETAEAFKWTENYIKSGKKKGFRTPNDLYKTWDLRAGTGKA